MLLLLQLQANFADQNTNNNTTTNHSNYKLHWPSHKFKITIANGVWQSRIVVFAPLSPDVEGL